MSSSTSGSAPKRPQLISTGWSWPHLVPIKQKQPLASAAGPFSASPSVRAPSEKSTKSTSPKASQRFRSPRQTSFSLPPISSKPSSVKSGSSEDAAKIDRSVTEGPVLAAEGSKSNTMVEEPTVPSMPTNQGSYKKRASKIVVLVQELILHFGKANEDPKSPPTHATEASADELLSAFTGHVSPVQTEKGTEADTTPAVPATEEHLNPMEDVAPHIPITVSEVPTPVEAPNAVADPRPVEEASPFEIPSQVKEISVAEISPLVEEFPPPLAPAPMTFLPPPKITIQRATEDIEPTEALPAATMAEILNELPSTSLPVDDANVLSDPLEGASAPVLPPLRRRKLYLRKVRNLAMRKTVLKAVLGRQLAAQTKPALRMLAHGERLLPADLSVLDPAVES
ncbi:hypothetical protein MMC08_001937 [Hypocenomyce scalaris]|nr:hypothetical protein [Hypocenomyce scalaris]